MADDIEEFWSEIRPPKEPEAEPSKQKLRLQQARSLLEQRLNKVEVEVGVDELDEMASSRASSYISGDGRIYPLTGGGDLSSSQDVQDRNLRDRLLDSMSPQQAAAAYQPQDEIAHYENERARLRARMENQLPRLPWDQASFVDHVFHEWSRMNEDQRRLLRDHILNFEDRYPNPEPQTTPDPTRDTQDLTNALASLGFPSVIELEVDDNDRHELTINLGPQFEVEVESGPDGTDIFISPLR